MANEKPCKNCGTPITKEYCEDGWPNGCDHWTPKKPMTNADRIRAMTDEELREFLCSNTQCEVCGYEAWGGCELLKWLKEPAEK